MILRHIYSSRIWIDCVEDLVAIEEKIAFYLLIYGFNIKRKNIKEKKEVLKTLIHLS